jgi:homoserine dehydrogenase
VGGVLRVGMLGCGTVGSAVARMLHDHAGTIARRAGTRIELVRVAVRDPSKARDVPFDRALLVQQPDDIVEAPDVDVVVELIGGIEPARSLIARAMAAGKSIVTANKALLSEHGRELFDEAMRNRVDVLYEAAVGGGIPVIRSIREHLAGDRVLRVTAILNGTTNFILTRMSEDGASLEDAVREAQALGYAEADPSADVEGHDAAAKGAILATIAFDTPVSAADVHREGITGVCADDMVFARRLGYVVKLLAVAETVDAGADAGGPGVSVRVYPAMIPRSHPLAAVRESFNAVLIEGERVGPLMLYGRGAGGDPTATSVVGDLIELARSRSSPGSITTAGHAAHGGQSEAVRRLVPLEELDGQYYLLLEVVDRSGVLAAVAHAFANHQVSIKQVWQEGRGEDAQLVLITHRAPESDLAECVRTLRGLGSVEEVRSVIRVEADDP